MMHLLKFCAVIVGLHVLAPFCPIAAVIAVGILIWQATK